MNWKGHHRRELGYSLIELLLALSLMTILAGIVVPASLRAYSGIQLRTTVSQLTATFREARVRSNTEGQVYEVVLFQSDHRITVALLRDGGVVRQEQIPSGMKVRSRVQGNEWTEGEVRIAFIPAGVTEASEIDVASTNGSHVSLSLDARTGRIRISRFYRGE